MASVSIQKRKSEDVFILDVEGRIDLFNSPKLRAEIQSALDDSPLPVLLNLGGVPYIDSSGLATLIEGLQRSKKAQREYGLIGLSERVRNVFDVAKLTGAFAIYPDEAAALEALRGVDPPA